MFDSFVSKKNSFVPCLLPAEAVRFSVDQTFEILKKRLGDPLFYQCIDPAQSVKSPVSALPDSNWMRSAKTVGVNVRTIGDFWSIVPYAMTLPAAQNALHILPMWECGVVSSLYGPASWNINPEFFSEKLAEKMPHLGPVEAQLKVTINFLHALGKAVGMDVVPHTDRFSEQVLANPDFFEWLVRRDLEIVDHSDAVVFYAKNAIFDFVKKHGSAVAGERFPFSVDEFFDAQVPENQRLRWLFGEKKDYGGRLKRRELLVDWLFKMGFETAPATMGPPYRGLEVDPRPEAETIDEAGRSWRDFRIQNPQKFSRAFGPLTRFRTWASKNENRDWALDFSRPRPEVFGYVSERYAEIARDFDVDFMRGDMSHVQMRPDGVPAEADDFYDLLGFVKKRIASEKPSFGYFAESFLAPDGEMAYGSEVAHLEKSLADTTLGDLQNAATDSPEFLKMLAEYADLHEKGGVLPNFTILTADKDDPRFDRFYLRGNEARFFCSIFLTDWPAYMALNFECRDPHPTPAANEFYSKLYVFQEKKGPKSTSGPFRWGQNRRLFEAIDGIRQFADDIFESIKNEKTRWILRPDGERKLVAWAVAEFVFAANLDGENPSPEHDFGDFLVPIFSTRRAIGPEFLSKTSLGAGECVVFRQGE